MFKPDIYRIHDLNSTYFNFKRNICIEWNFAVNKYFYAVYLVCYLEIYLLRLVSFRQKKMNFCNIAKLIIARNDSRAMQYKAQQYHFHRQKIKFLLTSFEQVFKHLISSHHLSSKTCSINKLRFQNYVTVKNHQNWLCLSDLLFTLSLISLSLPFFSLSLSLSTSLYLFSLSTFLFSLLFSVSVFLSSLSP